MDSKQYYVHPLRGIIRQLDNHKQSPDLRMARRRGGHHRLVSAVKLYCHNNSERHGPWQHWSTGGAFLYEKLGDVGDESPGLSC